MATFPETEFSGRCAAASLDVLASIFGKDMLPILLPILKEALSHPEWEVCQTLVHQNITALHFVNYLILSGKGVGYSRSGSNRRRLHGRNHPSSTRSRALPHRNAGCQETTC